MISESSSSDDDAKEILFYLSDMMTGERRLISRKLSVQNTSPRLGFLICTLAPRNAGSAVQALQNQEPQVAYIVREAARSDWWVVSELHCRAFYPRASCLAAALLRFDRVESIKNGAQEAQRRKSAGHFSCLVAKLNEPRKTNRLPGLRLPKFLEPFAAPGLREGFGKTPEEAGMIGTIIVESQGIHIPPRRRNGRLQARPGMAYICNLSVDETFRRRGVGRQLLQNAIQVAGQWGCRSVALHCDPRDQGARRLYLGAGFRRVTDEPLLQQFCEGRPGVRLELMLRPLHRKSADENSNDQHI